MDVNLFDYDLPLELSAQKPSDKRDESRLLSINREDHTFKDEHFFDILKYFKKGDVLVRNNTKVLPVRLFGEKKVTKAKVEVVLLKRLYDDTWECLCGNAKAIKEGVEISFNNEDDLVAKCIEVKDEGIRILSLKYNGVFEEVLDKIGHMPLPPYIKKQIVGNERYQTVYAQYVGSAAAPTAGFHFTDELLNKLKEKGVIICDVTLHIGLGTFRPVKVTNTDDHKMHSEHFVMTQDVADILNKAKEENRRIIAVGTTSVRTLEAIFNKYHKFVSVSEDTSIFIYPGYKYLAVDAIITNFHLPKSTLLMLGSAFMGREFALECYKHAVDEKYHFFSFGDAMIIYGNKN